VARVESKHQEQLAKRQEKQRIIAEKQKVLAKRYRMKEEVAEVREAERREREEKNQEAEERTKEAQEAIESIRAVLRAGLQVGCVIDWKKLKNHEPFSKPQPKPPVYLEYPREPQAGDARYQPALNLEIGPEGPVLFAVPT